MAFEKTKIIGAGVGAAGLAETLKHLSVEVGVSAVAGAGVEFLKHLIKF